MIGYYVHHHGAGHATRATRIAAHLSVTGFGSMPAPPGWPAPWIELPRDDEVASPADPTASGVLHWAPLAGDGLRSRMATIAAWIENAAPSVIVTDVSVEVTLLARLMGVPVAVVAMRGDRTDRPHVAAYDAASVLVAPWPASLPEPWPVRWLDKTVHVGAISRFDDRAAPVVARSGADASRRVTLLWGSGGDAVTESELAAVQDATPGWVWSRPDPADGADGVWRALHEADVVVTHAGQNAVAEVAAARRPAVVVATPRPFDEQGHTRAALEHAAIAVGIDGWPTPSRWPTLLATAADLGGDGWQRWSTGDGAQRAADAIARSRFRCAAAG